jgi:hypothetical protein
MLPTNEPPVMMPKFAPTKSPTVLLAPVLMTTPKAGDGFRRQSGAHQICALAEHIVRSERDALAPLLVHGHEGHINRT